MKRLFSVQSLLWAALALALVGSLRHVAWGFSTLERGDLIAGYVQAVAVDLGMLGLALGIQARKRQARPVRGLWAGVILFSAVSTYANLLHGLCFQTDLGLDGLGWLVAARPVILSGVLPLLVVYLSEIAGDDVNYTAKIAEREARKVARPASDTAKVDASTVISAQAADTLAQARETRKAQAEQAVSKLLTFYADNPLATQEQAAQVVARSRQWVSMTLADLESAGKIHRNGSGVELKVG